jgi:hypothetical protein
MRHQRGQPQRGGNTHDQAGPIDGKVNRRLNPFTESYAAVLILGLLAFGTITVIFEFTALFG